MDEALTYDDVLLVPQYSELTSRSEADPRTKLGALELKIPILSANMDTITGHRMAELLGEEGAAGVLHRYAPSADILKKVLLLGLAGLPSIPSVGVKGEDYEAAEEYRKLTDHVCLDIAHGDSVNALRMVHHLVKLDFKTIIAGNIATVDGALRLAGAGANVLKVGIGPGSVCTTRLVTGHGYPQFSAVQKIAARFKTFDVQIIADGGLKSSGDIVKALAVGAHAVMTGSLFAGCPETPSRALYRGMASHEAQVDWLGKVNNVAPEGIQIPVVPRQSAKEVLAQLAGGIRSGMSYSGARTLKELRENAEFVRVTSNGVIENGTRKP